MADTYRDKMSELRRTEQLSVGELVDRVTDFHQHVAEAYGKGHCVVEAEEAKLLLEHLQGHESRIAERLAGYRAEAPREVLETRLMYVPGVPLQSMQESIEIAPDMGRDQIAETAAGLADVLFSVYDAVAEGTAADSVREVLADLRAFEQREMIYALRSTEPH